MHRAALLALTVAFQPLPDPEVLEPSVRNEVDHAIGAAPAAALAAAQAPGALAGASFFPTNGVSATDAAIALVSTQRSDGRWLDGTNDVTAAALRILLSLR